PLGAGRVDVVDGYGELGAGGLGVGVGLDGPGDDAVVGGADEDDDVGEVGATGTQRGEGGVAGGVDKGDATAVDLHLIGADVLGDATRLALDDVGLADGVEEGGLAVVDVAHDGDHGRAGHEVLFGVVEGGLLGDGGSGRRLLDLDDVPEALGDLVDEL